MDDELLKQLIAELQGFRNEVNTRFDSVATRFDSVDTRFDDVATRFDSVEKGLVEIKDALRHNTTLTTENFTDIRIDLRGKNDDIQADVDLLFNEIEILKRKVHKQEKKLSN